MKKIILLLLLSFFVNLYVPKTYALSVSAEYACVIDAQTGRVIYEKNAHTNHSMASTTKIMTALVALENGNLNDIVTVGKNAAGTEGTSLYLKVGDKLTLSELLYGLMLRSGNDAAIAIAEHIAGDVKTFAELMTSRAQTVGAKNTSFKNPNGLDEEGHFTTAYDLAIITREALKNENFSEIVKTKSKSIQNGAQTVVNHNKLLNSYDGCIGVKTGYTKKTGRCLVSAAEREGKRVIAVTLNAPNDWADHRNMLDYAFSNTLIFPLIAKGMTVNTVTVKNGESESLELCADRNFFLSESPDTKFKNAKISLKIPEYVTAPIRQGEIIGSLEVYYKDELLDTINLIASANINYTEPKPHKEFFEIFKKLLVSGCQ